VINSKILKTKRGRERGTREREREIMKEVLEER
jgi:hypothetical protein